MRIADCNNKQAHALRGVYALQRGCRGPALAGRQPDAGSPRGPARAPSLSKQRAPTTPPCSQVQSLVEPT